MKLCTCDRGYQEVNARATICPYDHDHLNDDDCMPLRHDAEWNGIQSLPYTWGAKWDATHAHCCDAPTHFFREIICRVCGGTGMVDDEPREPRDVIKMRMLAKREPETGRLQLTPLGKTIAGTPSGRSHDPERDRR